MSDSFFSCEANGCVNYCTRLQSLEITEKVMVICPRAVYVYRRYLSLPAGKGSRRDCSQHDVILPGCLTVSSTFLIMRWEKARVKNMCFSTVYYFSSFYYSKHVYTDNLRVTQGVWKSVWSKRGNYLIYLGGSGRRLLTHAMN